MIERALIVGGGPGGMTAAIALARRGVRCELLEIECDWRPAGIGIGLQSPPLRALRSLDLLDPVLAVSRPHDEIDMLRADGQPIMVLPQMQVNEPEVPPFVTMSRVALHDVLETRLRELGVTVRLGATIDALDQTDHDLMVGADGLHSRLRLMVRPDAPQPQYAGQVIWRIGARRPPALKRYTMMIAGPTRIGLVPIGRGDDLYLWMLDSTLPPQRPPRDRLLALFQERLGAYGFVAPEVAAQITEPEQIDFRALHWLLLDPPWHSGRALLLGDAAHTTTPHLAFGVGLAIEDAVVLSELVAEGLEEAELGERFTARRYERCRLVVESSLQLSRWEQAPGTPGADPAALIGRAFGELGKPI
jgi:2-polyprenyl-6-methoxyphenol hydroxylase-like FAD-dependent oxidoreductase